MITTATVAARLRAAGCVFAEEEAELLLGATSDGAELVRMIERREAGVPLEQIVGWVDFAGVRVTVAPGTFVPRQRTTFLVEVAAAIATPGDVIVDLCCGVGAIGAAIAARVGSLRLFAADIEPTAVECARQNLAHYGGRVFLGDLYDALPMRLAGKIDVLAVNAPYVPTEAIALMPSEARDHEPRVALDGGVDGLDLHRRVFGEAIRWLRPGGALVIEVGAEQAEASARIAQLSQLTAQTRHSAQWQGSVVVTRRP